MIKQKGSRLSQGIRVFLRSRRVSLGLRMGDLAYLTGLSASGISNIENGQYDPQMETLAKMLQGLSVQATLRLEYDGKTLDMPLLNPGPDYMLISDEEA